MDHVCSDVALVIKLSYSMFVKTFTTNKEVGLMRGRYWSVCSYLRTPLEVIDLPQSIHAVIKNTNDK